MRIARDGTWFYHGSPIGRKPLVKLFSSVLRRDRSGDFWLVTPVEKARIRVDDAPFVAVEMAVSGEGAGQVLRFRTNIDEWVVAGPGHPLRVGESADGAPAPYVRVRGRLDALVARSVFYDLVELAELDAGTGTLYVISSGRRFDLGSAT